MEGEPSTVKSGLEGRRSNELARDSGACGDRRPPEGPREWDEAVRLLRAAWREPSRRELVRRVLRAMGR
jgi:hypothetical protein